MEAWLMQSQSLLIIIIMMVGVYFRHQRRLHVKLMSTAMIWDVILILQIELSRSAILKASKAVDNSMILNIHVALAVTTVVFYGLMIFTGRKLLAGQNSIRPKHQFLGWTTLALRVLTFITSFWAVTAKDTL